MAIKKEIDLLDATPSKRIYRSIIADYNLNTAICELIDNAVDVDFIRQGGPKLVVNINFDLEQQSILINDNAGGVRESQLSKLISPGESSIVGDKSTIGIFGVGSKRAVVALAQNIKIISRYQKEKTFRIEYDDEWLTSNEWELPYYNVTPINASTTEIELSNLRIHVKSNDILKLIEHISITYNNFIKKNKITIRINGTDCQGRSFSQWSYPTDFEPTLFTKNIKTNDGKSNIKMELIAGLTYEKGSIAGDYGVFFYCNNRLICRALKSPEVGFITGIAGLPHPKLSLARVIVHLTGPSDSMPWESDKAGINYNHYIFQKINGDIITAVKRYTEISKRLGPVFKEVVEPCKSGTMSKITLKKDETIRPSKLPPIPKSKTDYKTSILEANKNIVNIKPWVRGLYEGVIAEDMIFNQKKLEQKNRIALIVLDSTLEIAFKEFLANEVTPRIGDEKFEKLIKNRIDVHIAVEKRILNGTNIWKKIDHYYKARCDLIHKRANVSVPDSDIEDYRNVVKRMLKEMFKVRFPTD